MKTYDFFMTTVCYTNIFLPIVKIANTHFTLFSVIRNTFFQSKISFLNKHKNFPFQEIVFFFGNAQEKFFPTNTRNVFISIKTDFLNKFTKFFKQV